MISPQHRVAVSQPGPSEREAGVLGEVEVDVIRDRLRGGDRVGHALLEELGHRDVVEGRTVMRFTLLKKLVSGLNPGTVNIPEAKIRTSIRGSADPFGDPFAMLPFCGYHMGDYFAHWIRTGNRTPVQAQPKFFFVNWFRKTKEGKWLWPGYGENSRVLKWIFERCEGGGKAVETPIGFMPTLDAIEPPAGVTLQDMKELLEVDVAGWKAELNDIKTEHYPKFGAKLPRELREQLEALNKRLG